MITFTLGSGEVVCDPEGASVYDVGGTLVVDVPIQYRRPDGQIDVGSVYIGTEPMELLVREARRWGEQRAHNAHSDPNVGQGA